MHIYKKFKRQNWIVDRVIQRGRKKCCTALYLGIHFWKDLLRSIPVRDEWQDQKDWVRKYMAAMGSTFSLNQFIYLQSIIWRCIPVSHSQPSINQHTAVKLLVCSLPWVCSSPLWRPPRSAEHLWPQLPQGMFPTSLPPASSRATGEIPATQTPPRKPPAHRVTQGTAQRIKILSLFLIQCTGWTVISQWLGLFSSRYPELL